MSLIDALADQSEERARTRRVYGVICGVVSNNRDPEGLGRIKVNLACFADNAETDWAKMTSFMAGAGRGAVFLPEVGDEVLVAFEHGDIDRPYVIGALWNTKDKPPEDNADGKNNIRKIQSRSGHGLLFSDDQERAKERVEMYTKAGQRIVLDDSAGKEKIELEDRNGNVIVIDSVTNTISIESTAQLKIKARMIEIDAAAAMKIKAGGTLTIQGSLVKIN